ncbi:PadR family transcriptional regulator [uncultured Paludibaculum sp.]|uniref:PadR family transcriptional regulator n=1 Tax=uncultured Paludibaculum sp. TaxID=1765020 RepID=UPI002AAB7FAB|nr:PadR family transcriptional regulator [uncultured Paludibaculum sp.]
MGRHDNDRLQGTLDLLVLKVLASRGRMHGYGITLQVQQISQEELRVEEGSLYPALHRMAQDSLISAEWGTTENNRRARYYEITPAGRERLKQEEENWERLTSAVARFLKYA